jgi:hypothetical protein
VTSTLRFPFESCERVNFTHALLLS